MNCTFTIVLLSFIVGPAEIHSNIELPELRLNIPEGCPQWDISTLEEGPLSIQNAILIVKDKLTQTPGVVYQFSVALAPQSISGPQVREVEIYKVNSCFYWIVNATANPVESNNLTPPRRSFIVFFNKEVKEL